MSCRAKPTPRSVFKLSTTLFLLTLIHRTHTRRSSNRAASGAAIAVSRGRLDLDDLGAQMAEQHGTEVV